MKKPWLKKVLTQVLKAGLTALALYFIFTRIDFGEAWIGIKEANPLWLLAALGLFVASKAAAAMRLKDHFAAVSVPVSAVLNFKLYALGMYYNLFLPGGIGGDGYKAYWLNKRYETSVKQLIGALLLDRVNGLVALLALAIGMSAFLSLPWLAGWTWLIPLALVLLYIGHYIGLRLFFPSFLSIFFASHGWSLVVQVLQLLCVGGIYLALSPEGSWLSYAFIFLLSSIVSVLPLTIGGIGSREVVFLFGADWLSLNQDTAVTISLLFYGITALSSFAGSYYAWFPKKLSEKNGSNTTDSESNI